MRDSIQIRTGHRHTYEPKICGNGGNRGNGQQYRRLQPFPP